MNSKEKYDTQRDSALSHARELKDMGLVDMNLWPGYFMRKFALTYAQAVETAEMMARYVEVGKYARPKKVARVTKHERDDYES